VMIGVTMGALLLFALGLVLAAKAGDGERWGRGGPVSILDGALFSFQGRILRSSFWSVVIPIFLTNSVLGISSAAISLAVREPGFTPAMPNAVAMIVLAGVGVLIVLESWIVLATYAKRWHDIGHSGWMSMLLLIPLAGLFVFGYLVFSPGAAGQNKYGARGAV
jgi:uncharacterized membrane protein YhaH (DUF805 family)